MARRLVNRGKHRGLARVAPINVNSQQYELPALTLGCVLAAIEGVIGARDDSWRMLFLGTCGARGHLADLGPGDRAVIGASLNLGVVAAGASQHTGGGSISDHQKPLRRD